MPRRLVHRLRLAADPLRQAAAIDVLEREIGQPFVLADLVDLHDVRVLQTGDRLGLGVEPGQLLRPGVCAGQHHLQGDDAVQLRLPRLVDDAHAAAAQLGQDRIALDLRPRAAAEPAFRRRKARNRIDRGIEARPARPRNGVDGGVESGACVAGNRMNRGIEAHSRRAGNRIDVHSQARRRLQFDRRQRLSREIAANGLSAPAGGVAERGGFVGGGLIDGRNCLTAAPGAASSAGAIV